MKYTGVSVYHTSPAVSCQTHFMIATNQCVLLHELKDDEFMIVVSKLKFLILSTIT